MSGTLRGEIWGLSFAVAHSGPLIKTSKAFLLAWPFYVTYEFRNETQSPKFGLLKAKGTTQYNYLGHSSTTSQISYQMV